MYTYRVFMAGESAKIGFCDIHPLGTSMATCTNLKLTVRK